MNWGDRPVEACPVAPWVTGCARRRRSHATTLRYVSMARQLAPTVADPFTPNAAPVDAATGQRILATCRVDDDELGSFLQDASAYVETTCRSGGIGRRARFRF